MTYSWNSINRSLIVAAILLSCSTLPAAMGILETPSLAMPRDYPKADYEKIKAVLERKDCKFLGGMWLNAATSLRYGGDTTSLNLFIEALSLCPNLKVHVLFYRPTGGNVGGDWMVTQYGAVNQVEVRINLASDKIKIENLALPPVKAENAPG